MPFLRAGSVVHDAAGNTYLSGALQVAESGLTAKIDLDPINTAPDDPSIIIETQLSTGFIAKYDANGRLPMGADAEGAGRQPGLC